MGRLKFQFFKDLALLGIYIFDPAYDNVIKKVNDQVDASIGNASLNGSPAPAMASAKPFNLKKYMESKSGVVKKAFNLKDFKNKEGK